MQWKYKSVLIAQTETVCVISTMYDHRNAVYCNMYGIFCSKTWIYYSYSHGRNSETWRHSRGQKMSCRQFLFTSMKTDVVIDIGKIVCNFRTVFVDSNENIIRNFWTYILCGLSHSHKVFCL